MSTNNKPVTAGRNATVNNFPARPSEMTEMIANGGDPAVPSLSYTAALPDWVLARTLLEGARAVRACGEDYLPKYADESQEDYDARCASAPFVNHFRDHLETIVSKPFSKEVALQGDVTPEIAMVCENIDGEGSSLHKFARDAFKEALAMGLVGILVDFPNIPEGSTLADERNIGARPFWVSYRAEDILAVYTHFQNGRRYVRHVRLREDIVKQYGFTERRYRRVRILNDDGAVRSWQLWEEEGNGWQMIGSGLFSLPEIPFRIFKPGERDWWTNGTVSPLIDLAHLQIEHYQQSSNLKHILELSAFPMLSGNGVTPPTTIDPTTGQTLPATIRIGPSVVCFAPPVVGIGRIPEWKFIEPQGTSIDKLQSQIDRIEQQMAKIGKAPLIKNTGSITATTEAVNAAKGHATAEAWAIDLKDTIEQCLVFTAMWMGQKSQAEVYIHTDFGVELRESQENQELMAAREQGIISRETLWDEWKRRAFLGPQFDPEKEATRIESDQKVILAHLKKMQDLGLVNVPGRSTGAKTGKVKKPGKATLYAKNDSQIARDITKAAA